MTLMKTSNKTSPLFRYAKETFRILPRRGKIDFLCKCIIYNLRHRDATAVAAGLKQLFNLCPELRNIWTVANRTYTEQEGKETDLLFRYAFSRPANISGKTKN